MSQLAKPLNEEKRIEELKKYDLLDTPPDGAFDRITKLATQIFNVPIAIISLVDTERIWFKSAYGLSVKQIGRDPGLCASAILSDEIYVVNDAAKDPRTLTNPLVAGEFGLRFYAAAPLHTDNLCNLGTLCIIDKAPRKLNESEQQILMELSKLVMDEMQRRLLLRETVMNVKKLLLDIGFHIDNTIHAVKNEHTGNNQEKMLEYLEASRAFLNHAEKQIDIV